jgi:hypothetical protein
MALALPFLEVGDVVGGLAPIVLQMGVGRLTRYQLSVFGSIATLPNWSNQQQRIPTDSGVSSGMQAPNATFLIASHLGSQMKYFLKLLRDVKINEEPS